jgi:hypothetical protein
MAPATRSSRADSLDEAVEKAEGLSGCSRAAPQITVYETFAVM